MMARRVSDLIFFFFQAEDGIRYGHVTGVQTCALPISWDVGDSFGCVSAEASTYASAGDPPAATLALRVGGAAASGTVPFSELVHVGGEATVRGYAEQRFAGRTGAYANAELRLRLGWLSI